MIASVLAMLAWVASPSGAIAVPTETPPQRVTLGAPADQRALLLRLRAELVTIGYDVETVTADLADPNTELASLAEPSSDLAIIWVDVDEREVVLWIDEPGPGSAVRRSIGSEETGPGRNRIVAHRAVELLHASLSQLPPRPTPPTQPSPTPPPPRRPPPNKPRVALGAGVGAVGSRGGVPPAAYAAVAARGLVHRRIGVGAELAFPLHPRSIDASEGMAGVWVGWAIAWAQVELSPAARRWHPFVAAGAGALVLGVRGSAAPPLSGRPDALVAGTVNAAGGLAVRVAPRVRIVGHASIGAVGPRAIVRFAGREVAEFGSPWGAGRLGVELQLP